MPVKVINIIEVASSDDVGLAEVLDRFGRGLDVQFSSSLCSKEFLLKISLVSPKEISHRLQLLQ